MGLSLRAATLLAGLLACSTACLTLQERGDEPIRSILYLGPDDLGQTELFRLNVGEQMPTQMTDERRNVLDFAPSPDGSQVVFAAGDESDGTELWLIDASGGQRRHLLTCERAWCLQMVWHPDGRRLAYERRDLGEGAIPGVPRLWWLDVATAETIPVLEDDVSISQGASFSMDGSWLSYVGTPEEGIFIINLNDGRSLNVASEVGTRAVWSPDGRSLIIRNNQLVVLHGSEDDKHQEHSHEFGQGVHLFRVSVPEGEIMRISGDGIVDDASPGWSPDGEWLVVGRMQPRTSMGRQLWLMRPDGREAHSLTDRPEIHHGLPIWSPDGEFILLQRLSVLEADARPALWLYDVNTGEFSHIVESGFQATWLPRS
jgi:Tol biopolymer transport system component